MAPSKTIAQLQEIFRNLYETLAELDKTALRNKQLDINSMSPAQLNEELKERSSKYEKRALLLTEIGHLRINIFHEYYERVQILQNSKQLDKAVAIMQEYLEKVALLFIQERLHPSLLYKITHWHSAENVPDAEKTLQEWSTKYEKWFKESTPNQMNTQTRMEHFNELKMLFFTLYTISFSFDNFPPVATEPYH